MPCPQFDTEYWGLVRAQLFSRSQDIHCVVQAAKAITTPRGHSEVLQKSRLCAIYFFHTIPIQAICLTHKSEYSCSQMDIFPINWKTHWAGMGCPLLFWFHKTIVRGLFPGGNSTSLVKEATARLFFKSIIHEVLFLPPPIWEVVTCEVWREQRTVATSQNILKKYSPAPLGEIAKVSKMGVTSCAGQRRVATSQWAGQVQYSTVY